MKQTLKGLPLVSVPKKVPFSKWVSSIFRTEHTPIHYSVCKVGPKYYLKLRDISDDFMLVDTRDVPMWYVKSEDTIQNLYIIDEDFRKYLD